MTPLTKVSVDVEKELITRFKEVYPQRGSIKWFFNEVLRAFLEIHDPEKVSDEIVTAVERALHPFEEEGEGEET